MSSPVDPRFKTRENQSDFSDFASSVRNGPMNRKAHESTGGLTQFFLGAGLFGTGTYMLFDRVIVSMGNYGASMFGMSFGHGPHLSMTLVPFIAGIIILFVKGSSKWGWGLVLGGLALLIVQIIANLQIYFRATTLPMVLFIVGLMAAGMGLIARSLWGSSDA